MIWWKSLLSSKTSLFFKTRGLYKPLMICGRAVDNFSTNFSTSFVEKWKACLIHNFLWKCAKEGCGKEIRFPREFLFFLKKRKFYTALIFPVSSSINAATAGLFAFSSSMRRMEEITVEWSRSNFLPISSKERLVF